jgi:hypothetical protein
LQVRRYIADWTATVPDEPPDVALPHRCPTRGPAHRYRFALFIEKEGFYPLLERHRIADRYDVALMSTKGMSVTAARRLVDELSGHGVTVLVLRDFDASGFSIVHTLRTDGRRYRFRNNPQVIDLGLRLEDIRAMALQAEPVEYRGKKDPRERLRGCGATEAECDFLVRPGTRAGERVELNAMPSPEFIAFIERKFAEVGVAKVVPDDDTLGDAYRRAWRLAVLQEAVDRAVAELSGAGAPAPPPGLAARIAEAIQGSNRPWDDALWEVLREAREGIHQGRMPEET